MDPDQALPAAGSSGSPTEDLHHTASKLRQTVDTITVTDLDGREHRLQAREGLRVMEIIRASGLPMKAICGGSCACGTCHVYVLDGWAERLTAPAREELEMLDFLPRAHPNSRLACQLRFSRLLAGLHLRLAPE